MSPLQKYVRWMIILTIFFGLGYYGVYADNGANWEKRGAVNLGLWGGWITCMVYYPILQEIKDRHS